MAEFDIIEQHDDRLQRLEEHVSYLRGEVRSIKTQARDGFEMLSSKLDALNDIPERLTVVETETRAAKTGLKWVFGVMATTLAGLAVAGIKYFVLGSP